MNSSPHNFSSGFPYVGTSHICPDLRGCFSNLFFLFLFCLVDFFLAVLHAISSVYVHRGNIYVHVRLFPRARETAAHQHVNGVKFYRKHACARLQVVLVLHGCYTWWLHRVRQPHETVVVARAHFSTAKFLVRTYVNICILRAHNRERRKYSHILVPGGERVTRLADCNDFYKIRVGPIEKVYKCYFSR